MNVMLELELKRAFADWRFIILTIAMPVLIYISTSHQYDGTINGTPVASYLLVSMAVFGGIGAALTACGPRVATEREIGWTRQLRLTSMSSIDYVLVKLMSAAVITLVAIVAVLGLGGLANGVRMSAWHWLASGLAVWVGSWVFCVISLMLGYMFNSSSITVGLMVVNLGFSMLGGIFWPVDGFPTVLRWLAEATPTYHLAALGHHAQDGHLPPASDLVVLAGYLVVSLAASAWLYRRDEIRV